MKYGFQKGFTLVELIVVITILAILATIGFISFLGYAMSARDSKRINDISGINRALGYYKIKNGVLFQPNNAIPITLSGTVVGYQGDMGEKSLGKIGVSASGKDPLDDEYYTYFLSGNQSQVMALLERESENYISKLSLSTYADNSNRFPYFKGKGLGLLLESDNTSIHRSVDIIGKGEFDIFDPDISLREVKALFDNTSTDIQSALFVGGQLSLNSHVRTSNSCPENFISVPGNESLGQPDFCIGKYEASVDTSNNPFGLDDYELTFETIPGRDSIVSIQHSSIPVDCRGNGENYHMMTMSEWLTIVRNIEQVDENWSGGSVGVGHIKGGNNGNNITGFNANQQLSTGPTGNVVQDELRQLTLSNGEKIWDLVGNNWELVKTLNLHIYSNKTENEIYDTIVSSITTYRTVLDLYSIDGITSTSTFYEWSDIEDENFRNSFGPKTYYESNKGMGSVRQFGKRLTVVGGDYNNNSSSGPIENGLYSMIRLTTPGYDTVTTRCAYSY